MGDAKLTKFIWLSSQAKTVVLQLKHSILELVDTKETMVYQMMKSQIQWNKRTGINSWSSTIHI